MPTEYDIQLNADLNKNTRTIFVAFIVFIAFFGLILYALYQYIQHIFPDVKHAWFLDSQDISFSYYITTRHGQQTTDTLSDSHVGTYDHFAYTLYANVIPPSNTFIDIFSTGNTAYYIYLPVVVPLIYNYIYDNKLTYTNLATDLKLVNGIPSNIVFASNYVTETGILTSIYTKYIIGYINNITDITQWSKDTTLNGGFNENAYTIYNKFRGSEGFQTLLKTNWIDTVYNGAIINVPDKYMSVVQQASQNVPKASTINVQTIITLFILVLFYICAMSIVLPTPPATQYIFVEKSEFTIFIVAIIYVFALNLIYILAFIVYNRMDPIVYPSFYKTLWFMPRSITDGFQNSVKDTTIDKDKYLKNVTTTMNDIKDGIQHLTTGILNSVNKTMSNSYVTNGEIKIKRNLNIQ